MVRSPTPRRRLILVVLAIALCGLTAIVAASHVSGIGSPPTRGTASSVTEISPATPTASTELSKGISLTGSIYDLDSVLDRELDLVKSTGSTWVRADFDWSVTEPTRGTYDWQFLDRLVAHTADRGLRVLAVVDNTPTWARPAGTSLHGEPLDPNAFARFAADAAARYRPYGVTHWEIWNEPNIVDFWEPAPDADRYATLLRATAAAIHRVAPGVTVLSGGLSPSADGTDPMRIEPRAFLQTLYDSGAMADVDAVAMHPYTFPSDAGNPTSAFAQLPLLRSLAGPSSTERDIWITEFGAPTGTSPIAVSERQQAQLLTDACATAKTEPWLGPMFVYQLQDQGDDAADMFQNFGLLRHDGTRKPAYSAWRDC